MKLLGMLACIVPMLAVVSTEAKASETCDRYAAIVAAAANNTASESDMVWAMEVERSKQCDQPAQPVRIAPARAVATIPSVPRGIPVPAGTSCAGAKLDDASTNPCDMVKVAEAYEKGEGRPKNTAMFIAYLQAAAEAGHRGAAVRLGYQYEVGNGVPKDGRRAVALYRSAAERGSVLAQYFLGMAHMSGEIVQRDLREARLWLTRAAQGGDEDAPRHLARIDAYERGEAAARRAASPSGPSLYDQARETNRRQARENCAAAAKGANRACSPN